MCPHTVRGMSEDVGWGQGQGQQGGRARMEQGGGLGQGQGLLSNTHLSLVSKDRLQLPPAHHEGKLSCLSTFPLESGKNPFY